MSAIKFCKGSYFDSRDVAERLAELRAKKLKGGGLVLYEENKELKALEKLEALNLVGWEDGITFVHEFDFEDHAIDFIENCGWIDFETMPDCFVNGIRGKLAEIHYESDDFKDVELNGQVYTYREHL